MVTRRQRALPNDEDGDDDRETEGLLRSRNGTTGRRTFCSSDDSCDTKSGNNNRQRIPSSDSTEIADLNLDHLTNRKVEIVSTGTTPKSSSSSKKVKKFYKTYYGRTISVSEYCRSHLSMICYYYPYTCGFTVMLLLMIVMIMLASLMFKPVQTIKHDFSNIKSKYDPRMGTIDHWCLGGGNDDCLCADPTVPLDRHEYKSWIEAFKSNRKLVKRFADKVEGSTLDVAFVGESIVEEIDGRWMGIRNRSQGLSRLEIIFNQHFRKKLGNATYEGVALGIAGDTSPNVLFRLLYGEMPEYFQPKIWWLSLGNNDLGRTECSEEIVVIGILRVVEEILDKRPNARVVINSLFPMTTTRGGRYPVISDYEDSFIRLGNGRSLRRKSNLTKKKPQVKKPLVPIISGPSSVLNDDVDMSAAAEQEEVLRDQEAQNERSRRHDPPAQKDPIMVDGVTKSRERGGGTSMSKKQTADKPLWTSIRAINKELKKFADKNDRVMFFDATELFAKKLSSNKYQLLTDRISDRGHPTEEGFRIWEDEIVKKLDQIMVNLKQDYPELFKPVSSWYGGGGDTTKTSPNTGGNGKTDLMDGNRTTDDDVISRRDDDLDPTIFAETDDFNKNDDDEDEKAKEDKNILIDPDDSNNDDDHIPDGDLIVPPPLTKTTNDDDNDDRP